MYCFICGDDIEEKGQDNVSPVCGKPLCEDCLSDMSEDEIDALQEPYDID